MAINCTGSGRGGPRWMRRLLWLCLFAPLACSGGQAVEQAAARPPGAQDGTIAEPARGEPEGAQAPRSTDRFGAQSRTSAPSRASDSPAPAASDTWSRTRDLALDGPWPPDAPFRAVVSRVEDGDTLTVRAGSRSIRVRLEGIDAPEGRQRFGVESRNHLRTLVFDRQVEVRPTGVDRYDRLLARLVVDRQDVCEAMVEAGWAWHYRQYSRDARLADLERQARSARRGLWADPAPRAPWDERAIERARENRHPAATGRDRTGVAPPSSTQPSSKPRSPAGRSVGPFHGNVQTLVYHAPGCRDYHCRNCTAVFATRQAAEAAGYRPHAACVR